MRLKGAVAVAAADVLVVVNAFAIPEYPWNRGMGPTHARTQEPIDATRVNRTSSMISHQASVSLSIVLYLGYKPSSAPGQEELTANEGNVPVEPLVCMISQYSSPRVCIPRSVVNE